MKINDIIFIDNLNSLDLHGYDRITANLLISDFIKENLILKNEFIVIIHGIGSGVLRNTTQEVLRKNKNVIEYKTSPYNPGCTIVHLNLTK